MGIIARIFRDLSTLIRGRAPATPDYSDFSPWTLACAVGLTNGTLAAAHPEFQEQDFERWIAASGLSAHAQRLRQYALENSGKGCYQVLSEERSIRGRLPVDRPRSGSLQIIFLDFDGVLVPRHLSNKQEADKNCVAVLNSILATTGAHIVVSSDWRLDYNLDSLVYVLRHWGIDPSLVIGITPRLPGNNIRGNEIQAWLDERDERFGDIGRFVILDDYEDMAHLRPFLVRSTLDVGLTDELGAQAIKMLSEGGI